MDHLAIPVSDQDRSRAFYERYFGFGTLPARRYDDGVLMLYDQRGFALALGPAREPIGRPRWMHFGVGLPDRDAVLALRDRLVTDGVELVEEWDEPEYVSVKCRDPDGYIVEASWEPPPRSVSGPPQHAPQNAMSDPGEIGRFYDRCSDLMRELLDGLADAPDRPRTFPQIEDAIGWPRRRIASVLGGVAHLRHTEFGGRRPYRFHDERAAASGRWEMWMDAEQARAVRAARRG